MQKSGRTGQGDQAAGGIGGGPAEQHFLQSGSWAGVGHHEGFVIFVGGEQARCDIDAESGHQSEPSVFVVPGGRLLTPRAGRFTSGLDHDGSSVVEPEPVDRRPAVAEVGRLDDPYSLAESLDQKSLRHPLVH